MTEEIKDFIRDNIQLIDENRWDDFYWLVSHDHTTFSHIWMVGQLTEFLISCDCTFDTLTHIPEGFLFNSHLSDVEVPSNVLTIGYSAFAESDITTIKLPKNCCSIQDRAFAHCKLLRCIQIDAKAVNISIDAFYDCDSLRNIIFNGTMKQWLVGCNSLLFDCVVDCVDGTVIYDEDGYVL